MLYAINSFYMPEKVKMITGQRIEDMNRPPNYATLNLFQVNFLKKKIIVNAATVEELKPYPFIIYSAIIKTKITLSISDIFKRECYNYTAYRTTSQLLICQIIVCYNVLILITNFIVTCA